MSDKIKYKCSDCGNEFYETNYSRKYGVDTNPNCPKCGSSSVSHDILSTDTLFESNFYFIIFWILFILLTWGSYTFIFKDPAKTMWFMVGITIVGAAIVVLYFKIMDI